MFRRCIPWLKDVQCDVCVVGGGPAGVAAALRAVDFNKSVCLIEKSRIGGADLWNGALQSKTLWEVSKFVRTFRGDTSQRFSDRTVDAQLDHGKIRKIITDAAQLRENQMMHQLDKAGVYTIFGSGSFLGPRALEVQRNDGGDQMTVKADYYIIASGSTPREHPQYKADGNLIVTSDHIMNDDLPGSVVVIGAGVIGMEFASILANLGDTKVSVIEKATRILPMEDEDIALFVQKLLKRKGVTFHHESALRSLDLKDGKVNYTIRNNNSGEQSSFVVDKALVSIGRVPYYAGLGLESLDNSKVSNGKLLTDDNKQMVGYEHIYVCGDASLDIALVNVGELEARRCIDHIYSCKPVTKESKDNLSTIMFLDQEVAAVGLNEQQCKKQRIGYKCAVFGYNYVGRACAMGNTKGFVKLLVTNDREQRVLGVRAIGPHASSVVELASLSIHNRQSVFDLQHLMPAYPAVTNGFQECLRMLLGTSIMKPSKHENPNDDENNHLKVTTWTPPEFAERGRSYSAASEKK